MKERMKRFADESYDDLDDNIGIVMPILTECDVDEDFTEGIDKVGKVVPILPLRNMVLFPSDKRSSPEKNTDRRCLSERDEYGGSGF